MLCLNARSITSKFVSLLSIVSSYSPHVIGITETWLHDGIYDSEFTPPGYVAVRADRRHAKGGGVAILFRSDLTFHQLPSPLNTESVWCKLYLQKTHVAIGIVYRAPNSSLNDIENLNQYVSEQKLNAHNLVCMGDFNAPGID